MNLEPNDLLIFAKVVDAGGFARAADRLGIPKSTVSRRISVLEAVLGERLLQRTTRSLVVTEFGQRLLESAQQVAAETEQAAALAESNRGQITGRLRVSMPGDLAAALSRSIAAFVSEHPALQLEIDLSPRRVDVIAEGFDLAVRTGALADDPYLAARRIADLGAGLYAAPRYLERAGQLEAADQLAAHSGLHLTLRSGEAAPWRLQSQPDETWTGVLPRRTLANAYDLLTRLAVDAAGIAVLPDLFARPFLDTGALVAVLPNWRAAPAPVWCVFPSRRFVPAKVRAFADVLSSGMRTAEPARR